MKKLVAVFGMILALSACADDPLPPPAPVSQALPPKIVMDVHTIRLADRSNSQGPGSLYASDHFSPTIAEAIRKWAGDRLQAGGESGEAIVIIKDASLTVQPLPTKDDIDSWFTRQQGLKYMGHADVSIEANGKSGYAMTDASASRVLTLPEDPTPIEKQDAYFTMLNGLMKDLGQNLESGIGTHMANFVMQPPVYGVTAVQTGAAPVATVQSQSLEQPAPQAPVLGTGKAGSLASSPDSFSAPAPAATIPLTGAGGR
ncbi:MAG: hypothetical protein P4M13_07230 [Alphaproteobacteria bacterium]|nr:hypothetical protein [Alphaproteobacteria bacterium]